MQTSKSMKKCRAGSYCVYSGKLSSADPHDLCPPCRDVDHVCDLCASLPSSTRSDWSRKAKSILRGPERETSTEQVQLTLAASQTDRRKACADNASLAQVLITLRRDLDSSEARGAPPAPSPAREPLEGTPPGPSSSGPILVTSPILPVTSLPSAIPSSQDTSGALLDAFNAFRAEISASVVSMGQRLDSLERKRTAPDDLTLLGSAKQRRVNPPTAPTGAYSPISSECDSPGTDPYFSDDASGHEEEVGGPVPVDDVIRNILGQQPATPYYLKRYEDGLPSMSSGKETAPLFPVLQRLTDRRDELLRAIAQPKLIRRFKAEEAILPPFQECGPFFANYSKPYSSTAKPSLGVVNDLEKAVQSMGPTSDELAMLANAQITLLSSLRQKTADLSPDTCLLDIIDTLALSVNCGFSLAVRQYGVANKALRRVACDKSGLSDASLKSKALNQPLDAGSLFHRDFQQHLQSLADSIESRKKLAVAFGPQFGAIHTSGRPASSYRPSYSTSASRGRGRGGYGYSGGRQSDRRGFLAPQRRGSRPGGRGNPKSTQK
jgi:hypothetical protein